MYSYTLKQSCFFTVKMNAIRLLLVSALLFYNDISGPIIIKSADISTMHTVLKQYMSRYNKMFEASSSNGTCSNKSRNILTAKINQTLSAPFTAERWNAISRYKNDKIVDESEDLINDSVVKVFDSLCGFLSIKLGEWLPSEDPKKVDAVEYYFGYDKETEDIINVSITELMSHERKGNIFLTQFVSVFYYLLDLKNIIVQSKSNRARNISNMLQVFYDNLLDVMKIESKRKGKKQMLDELVKNLELIEDKVNPSFGVTIPAMKMWLLSKPTNNKYLKDIQNLKPYHLDPRTVKKYVESYAHEYDVYKINRYHVAILGVLIPNLFRYVHNYFMMLLNFEKHRNQIDDEDKKIIKEFPKFMQGYMSVFVDRYFEFKGEINQEIVDALFPILFFLEPSVSHFVIDQKFTKNETNILKKLEDPDVTITLDDYINMTKHEDHIMGGIKKLIDSADTVILKSFTDYDTKTTIEEWNKKLKKKLGSKTTDKLNLKQNINKNNEEAFSILTEFSNALTVKYSINDTPKI